MSDEKFINQLKDLKQKIKQTKEENKNRVEKLKNSKVEEKKRLITCIVNLQLIEKMLKDKTIFTPYEENAKLVWLVSEDYCIDVTESIDSLRRELDKMT